MNFDFNALATFVTALGTFISLLANLWLHRKCKANEQVVQSLSSDVQQLETAPKPPSVDEVLQMYTTADKTLKAVHKLLRGHGRTIQAAADSIIKDGQPTTSTLSGGRTGVGGIIRRPGS